MISPNARIYKYLIFPRKIRRQQSVKICLIRRLPRSSIGGAFFRQHRWGRVVIFLPADHRFLADKNFPILSAHVISASYFHFVSDIRPLTIWKIFLISHAGLHTDCFFLSAQEKGGNQAQTFHHSALPPPGQFSACYCSIWLKLPLPTADAEKKKNPPLIFPPSRCTQYKRQVRGCCYASTFHSPSGGVWLFLKLHSWR